METKFNFKSQVCTSRSQSERLLALGLKKETVDCYWWQENDQYGDGNGKWHLEVLDTKEAREHFEYLDKIFDDELFIPAWSLHRLIEMMPQSVTSNNRLDYYKVMYNSSVCYQREYYNLYRSCKRDLYEDIVSCIEWLIKEGYFNKEYLVNQAEIEEHCKGVLEYLDYIKEEEE